MAEISCDICGTMVPYLSYGMHRVCCLAARRSERDFWNRLDQAESLPEVAVSLPEFWLDVGIAEGGEALMSEIADEMSDNDIYKRVGDVAAAAPLVSGEDAKPGDCAICMESLSESQSGVRRVDGCGHEYCAACIERWCARSVLCPLCKHDMSAKGGYVLVDPDREQGGRAVFDIGSAIDGLVWQNVGLWITGMM